jgi:tetratricopeptide (TPR) repeat protein
MQRGKLAEAEAEYKAARRLNPRFAPAAINLADLYRSLGRDDDGVTVLRDAVAAAPQDASLYYAIGLVLVRQKKLDDALPELKRAAELAPEQAYYGYVYAVGLHSAGRVDDAIAVLKDNLTKHPMDRESLLALVSFYRDSGNVASALEYAQRLAQIAPNDRRVADLINSLKRQTESAPR